MNKGDVLGLKQFLRDYPGMSIMPSRDTTTVVKGKFSFSAQPVNGVLINDSFYLEIVIPRAFPQEIPKVIELEGKIPRDGKYHVNHDNTLCLGSPLRLLQKIYEKPNLVGFSERCLVPYLYAVSHKLRTGGSFVFNELAHGEQGIIEDYLDLFGLKKHEQVIQTLALLGMKKRIANKSPCPCGCGLRLGKCKLHLTLNRYRNLASRSWFKVHAKAPGVGV